VAVDQPGSPIVIMPTFVDAGDPLRPRFGYSITNTTEKAIIAYAIQKTVNLGQGTPIITTTLTHLPATKLFIRPHDSRQEEDSLAGIFEKPPIEITLSVDFVEFADSKRWGDDRIKSGERLDGERAGARAALKEYRAIAAAAGVNALVETWDDANLIKADGKMNSSNWLDGFKTGVNIIKKRLAAAKATGGADGVRKELAKPYDATEGRLDP
jgi:hypothetical protein